MKSVCCFVTTYIIRLPLIRIRSKAMLFYVTMIHNNLSLFDHNVSAK